MKYKKYLSLIVFFTYFLISLAFTFPFVFNLGNSLIGRPLDGYLYIWNVDSFWSRIFSLQSPFYTNIIFYPVGANLALNTSAPLISLFGLPFLKHIPFYLNSLILLSLPFSAFFMYRLTNKITNNKPAGFISGFFYGFSPIIFSYIISQHFYFAFAAVFIPLGIYYCEDFVERLKPADLAKVLLIFGVIFLIDYYSSVLYLAICFVYIFSKAILYKKLPVIILPKNLLSYIKVFLLTFLIPLAVFYFLVFSGSNLKTFSSGVNNYPSICSARLPDFVIPASNNPVLGRYSDNLRRILKNPESGDTPYLFLGYASLLAGFLTIFIKSGYVKSLPFFATGIAVLLLSMGPPALVFKYFSKLPFMSFIDCPQRFTIGVQLALAALIGILISLIKIKNKIVRIILLLIFLTIFMIEYGTTGLPLTKLTIPYVYKTVAAQENDLTVLELPSGLTESKGAFGYDWSIWGLNSMQMYWQTIHRKPKVGGYVSRIDDNTYSFFKNEPVISDLLTMVSLGGEWNGKSFSQTQIEAFIKNFNLGYIILSPNARQSEFARVIEDLFYLRISEKITKEGYVLYILIKN